MQDAVSTDLRRVVLGKLHGDLVQPSGPVSVLLKEVQDARQGAGQDRTAGPHGKIKALRGNVITIRGR